MWHGKKQSNSIKYWMNVLAPIRSNPNQMNISLETLVRHFCLIYSKTSRTPQWICMPMKYVMWNMLDKSIETLA